MWDNLPSLVAKHETALTMRFAKRTPTWRPAKVRLLQRNIAASSFRYLPRVPYSTASASFPFQVFRDVPPLRVFRRQLYEQGKQVGFVPTMGALHDGHTSLVRHALRENTDVFVSIYVNPTQFGVNEDLAAYPKTFDADMKMLQQVQQEAEEQGYEGRISGIFAPTTKVMYPTLPPSSEVDGDGSFVTITPLSKWLEGSSRPVFFRGVATVCTKLFNAVQPDIVYFGQKDGQQSVLIRRLVKDFLIPTEVKVIPTSREQDGLAMSSRNVYLGERRRKDAVVLSKALFAAQKLYDDGERSAGKIREAALKVYQAAGAQSKETSSDPKYLQLDYVALTRADDMTSIDDADQVDAAEGAMLSTALYVHPLPDPRNEEEKNQRLVRLIDNVILQPKP